LQSGEAALLAEIDTLQGQPGYANALKYDTAYVAEVNWLQPTPRTSQQL